MSGSTPATEVLTNEVAPDQAPEQLQPGGFHPYRPVLDDDFENKETNLARPLTDAVVTIRVIKSFAYRSMKALVLKNLDLTTMTVADLEERCRKGEQQPRKQPRQNGPSADSYTRLVHDRGQLNTGIQGIQDLCRQAR